MRKWCHLRVTHRHGYMTYNQMQREIFAYILLPSKQRVLTECQYSWLWD